MSLKASSDSDDLISAEFDIDDFQDETTRKACEEALGYVPGEDSEFDWIVTEAMDSPLPEGWRMYQSSHGDTCFFNATTRKFQSVRPFDDEFADKLRNAKVQRADETVVPLFDNLSISSVHRPCDSTSESIDKEFERLNDEIPKPKPHSKNSNSKSKTKTKSETKQTSPQRKTPKKSQQEIENDEALIEAQEQQLRIEEIKRRNQQKLDQLKREHRYQKARLKEQQRQEINSLINEIESIKREKLKKYASDRDKYRAAVRKFVDDFEVEERFQIEDLENNLKSAKQSYELQLGKMKFIYERELQCIRRRIEMIQEQGNAEIERLKMELEQRKKHELEKFERDIFGEKKRILKERLQEKKAELRICTAKIISLKQRQENPPRLRISSPFGLNIIDDENHLKFAKPIEIFSKCDREDMTLTEIPAFASFKPRQVRFHDLTDGNIFSVSHPIETISRVPEPPITEITETFQTLPKPNINVQSQTQKPIKVFEYPRVFWTPQPVRRKEVYSKHDRNKRHKSRRRIFTSSDDSYD